jgi:hypothetical protein
LGSGMAGHTPAWPETSRLPARTGRLRPISGRERSGETEGAGKSAPETVENELYGKPCEKHTGNPPDDIGSGLTQKPDEDVGRAHRNIGDDQTQPHHCDDGCLLGPALGPACQQHDRGERSGTGDQRKGEGEYGDIARPFCVPPLALIDLGKARTRNVSVNACRNNNIPPATRNAGSETSRRESTKLPTMAKNKSISPAIATERRDRIRRSLWWIPDVSPANMTAVSIGPIVTNGVTKLARTVEGTCIGVSRDRDCGKVDDPPRVVGCGDITENGCAYTLRQARRHHIMERTTTSMISRPPKPTCPGQTAQIIRRIRTIAEERQPSPLAIRASASVNNSGSENLWLSATGAVVTAGDGSAP